MPLMIVAIPIGNPKDLSLRAKEVLAESEVIIGEETKELRRFLKLHEIVPLQIELCNEHSTTTEIEELSLLCKEKKVSLVSDCGTPGFCDPGAQLIRLCRNKDIKISAVPGASSLTTIISLSSISLNEFVFKGFLPAKNELRLKEIKGLASENRAIILMDTPYRLGRLLEDLARICPERRALIGLNLTQDTEQAREGSLKELYRYFNNQKAEFIMIIYPRNKK